MMFNLLVSLCLVVSVASYCTSDMNNLESVAKRNSQGKNPDGKCYSHVADYIDATGYGGINKNGFNDAIPPSYWQYAYQFAEYLNQGSNAADLCLKNVQGQYSNNPYKAPTGSIVVVRAGTPGTAHPTAGDIAVVGGGDYFWNGGEMSYGGSSNFPPSNDYVLGIYVPTECVGNCNGGGGGGSCDKSCQDCVKNAGGKACASRCDGCSQACLDCINHGGGTGCASKCAPSSQLLYGQPVTEAHNTTLVQGRSFSSSSGHKVAGTQSSKHAFPGQPNFRTSYLGSGGDTCTGPHEFCCEAPGDPKETCPSGAYTADCAKKGACCCA